MKILATAITAVFATVAVANATDIPNRKKAPEVRTAAEAAGTFGFGYGAEYGLGDLLTDKTSDSYGVRYKHRFGQYSLGAALGVTQDSDGTIKHTIEGQAGYTAAINDRLSVDAGVGVGQRYQEEGNFPYFALYGAADYKASDTVTINAISYRYRDAFESGWDFQSHQVGTGVTVKVTENTSVSAKVYRQFDSAWGGTADGIGIGATLSF